MMTRRQFISLTGAAMTGAGLEAERILGGDAGGAARLKIAWHRHKGGKLFDRVSVNGEPICDPQEGVGLLDGFCQTILDGKTGPEVLLDCNKPVGERGPTRFSLAHRLLASAGGSTEDLLEATLTLMNAGDLPCEVVAGFLTGMRPCRSVVGQQVYVPLSAAGLRDADGDPRERLKDCRQTVGPGGFLCHYLEVQASAPRNSTTRAPLLVPVVDLFADGSPCRVALFGSSLEPLFFEAMQGPSSRAWRMGRRVHLGPGQTQVLRVHLLLHPGDATEAWSVFHRYGHHEDFTPLAWPQQVRVHYFDFLSPAEADGHRGGGYDLDLRHFGEFHVGMATQHGYYLSYGDFVHPDRKEWRAMPTDSAGAVPMSIETIKARVDATRRAGVHPAIYMHYTILDEGSPLFERMRDSVLVDAAGKPVLFGWEGPDVIKKTWKMSHTSPQWRDHLVQQAQWIMELFNPDAIVLDETFTAWGHDYHKDHGGSLSLGGIELMRRLRAAVRGFGPDKALFASDCSMANFCLWGDGEGGDHCYDRLLGHELYRQPPNRYRAALGRKAWLPCAWLYKSLWPAQVDLARKAGAAVGVTNGWGDSFGLTRLPADARAQMLRDIESLAKGTL